MTDISKKIRNHFAVFFLVIALICAVVDIILFRTDIPKAFLAYILLIWKGSAYRTPQKAQQMGTLKWSFPAQQMGTFSESISTKMHFFGSTTFSQIP